MTRTKNDFDHIAWRNQFEAASKNVKGFRELRAEVFQNTVRLVKNGDYYTDDIFINIPNKLPDRNHEYFDAPEKLDVQCYCQTEYAVFSADCLETAGLLLRAGFCPCALNLASPTNPGGGVCLVLGAFGCGFFRNPPNHMEGLFKETFLEKEFRSKFKLIVFAILEDHNSNRAHNPKGNILPFLEIFSDFGSKPSGD